MDSDRKIRKAYESILGNDFEQAIDWFEQAVEEQPDNADYHYKLSITYARSNKLDKALDHAEQACRLDGRNRKYFYHLQHLQCRACVREAEKCLEQSGQIHLAVSLLQKATALDPLAVEAHLLLAAAYLELNECDKAVRAAREALKLDPQNRMAKKLHQDAKQRLKSFLHGKE